MTARAVKCHAETMTAPATTSRPVTAGPAPFGNAAAAKPMTDEELRLECAKLAVALKPPAGMVVSLARDIYDFVKG